MCTSLVSILTKQISSDLELREALSLCSSLRPILRLALAEEQLPKQEEADPSVLLRTILENASRIAPQFNEMLSNLAQNIHQQASSPSPCKGKGHWGFHRQRVTELGNEGIVLMDAKDYVAARSKFEEQLNLIRRPWHRSAPLYNIACCDALLGNTESAFIFLEQAIQTGFRDVEHMKNDPDFESIRGLEEFQRLLEKVAEPTFFNRCTSFARGRQEWFELQQQALALMEANTPESLKQARELLERQVKLCPHPRGQRIPLYNIACCEALLGNSDDALSFLHSAVNAGYRNLRHIEADPDLESLRELDAYKQLIESIKSDLQHRPWWRFRGEHGEEAAEPEQPTEPIEPEQPAELVQEPAEQPAEPAQEPAEQPAEPESTYFSLPEEFEQFRTQVEVLAQMGFLEVREVLNALVSARGDVAQAIENLLQ